MSHIPPAITRDRPLGYDSQPIAAPQQAPQNPPQETQTTFTNVKDLLISGVALAILGILSVLVGALCLQSLPIVVLGAISSAAGGVFIGMGCSSILLNDTNSLPF